MNRMERPVVIKLGSSTLVDARGRLRKSRLDRIADEIGAITADTPICIVSSGAIALGLGHLGRMDRPGTVAEQHRTEREPGETHAGVGEDRAAGDAVAIR